MIKIYPKYEPIPGYCVIEKIGVGGFGEVWKCSAPGGLLKAIKFVSGKLGEKNDPRADQEWRSIDRIKFIRHPFILTMERIDLIENCLVIVMELADKNLWARYLECKQSPLKVIPVAECLNYLSEAAEALDLINSHYQLQHLDIKPQNLFLVHNHLKIGDFGLVHDLTISDQEFKGGITPIYSAPELIEGWPSKFSDQYSLAIVYQEMTSGKRPFEADNLRTLIKLHLYEKPDLSSLPENEKQIIAKALSKKPEDRFNTCSDLINALKNVNFKEAGNLTPNKIILSESIIISSSEKSLLQSEDELSQTQSFKKTGGRTDENPQKKELSKSPKLNRFNQNNEKRSGSLIIGLGKTGIGSVAFFKTLTDNHPDYLKLKIPFEVVGIGADHLGPLIDQNDTDFKLPQEKTIVCRLNRPNYYLGDKEKAAQLEKWLPLSKLYQIPKSLTTEGNRVFGKLAMIDSQENIELKLKLALNKINLAAFSDTLPGIIQPQIFLVGHSSGGMFGSLIDICNSIAKSCAELGLHKPEISLLLIVPTSENLSKLAANNTSATLVDIQNQNNLDLFTKTLLLGTEGNPKIGYAKTMQDAGLIIYTNLQQIYSQGNQINQQYKSMNIQPSQIFKTVGVSRHSLITDLYLQESINQVSLQVIDSWIQPKPILTYEINSWLDQKLAKNQINFEDLAFILSQELEATLGQSIESFILKEILEPLFLLESSNNPKDKFPDILSKTSLDILTRSEEYFGCQWISGEKFPDKGSFWKVMSNKTKSISEKFGTLIDSWVVFWIEKPGYRFGASAILLRCIKEKLDQFKLQLQAKLEKCLSSLNVDLIRLNNSLQQIADIKSNFFQPFQKIIELFKTIFRSQVEIHQYDCILIFLQTVNLQLNEHSKELETCVSKLSIISERITSNDSEQIKPPIRNEKIIKSDDLVCIDNLIQETIVRNFQAFTQIFIGSDNLLFELEKTIQTCTLHHFKSLSKFDPIQTLIKSQDSSTKINFIKTHIALAQHSNLLHTSLMPCDSFFSFPQNLLGEWNDLKIDLENSNGVFLSPGNEAFIACVCEENIENLQAVNALNHFFNKNNDPSVNTNSGT